MAAIVAVNGEPSLGKSRRRWLWLWMLLAIPLTLVFVSWWLTEPLDETPVVAEASIAPVAAESIAAKTNSSRTLTWPEGKLEGDAAKRLLLEVVEDASRRIDQFESYTATFKKQERIDGKLLPEQTLAMKVRHKSFAIYFKFLAPKAGKEVVYAEGHHHNKVIAHNGDWTRRLVPRLTVDPTSKIALADSRHPITDAGLSNLARKLVAFRKLDLEDADAETILDRVTDADGRLWYRSIHLHSQQNPSRPYTRVEVLFDPKTLFPLQIASWDWPQPGHSGELPLAERYQYENLVIDPGLNALDFDPANPSYEFFRF